MNNNYYIIRCAYKRLLMGKVVDAVLILRCWLQWQRDICFPLEDIKYEVKD